ncbi:MAG UNVERIFIED_CONTAM: hypothetical protein LVR18_02975 [Planctomycetaceae bacterium]
MQISGRFTAGRRQCQRDVRHCAATGKCRALSAVQAVTLTEHSPPCRKHDRGGSQRRTSPLAASRGHATHSQKTFRKSTASVTLNAENTLYLTGTVGIEKKTATLTLLDGSTGRRRQQSSSAASALSGFAGLNAAPGSSRSNRA